MNIKFLLIFFIVYYSVIGCKKDGEQEYISQNDGVFISDKLIPDSHFLGDGKCKECHQEEFKEWKGSHHDKAMDSANHESVLGNFDDVKFTSQGVTSHFFKKGDDFFVNTEGPDGKYYDYKIIYTFGVTPLQQYIVEFPDGRFQCLRTAWDSVKNKWFDLYPDFKVVHSEWLHWSRGGLNWNTMCSDCHSTNVRKNYDLKTESFDTKYAIINVNCEACHGPGKQHVEDVNRLGDQYASTKTMHMTSDIKPKELVDQCARCHMRREQFSEAFNFEGTMLDHYFPQLIEEPIYYADGQIRDEDYVYGSFTQSKMYKNNVTCNNCHNSHSLKLKFEGNNLCAQCHVPENYDTPKHHFHKMDTDGSQCINCHMPGKFYMGNDFRRDHSFRVPRPDLSVKYGTPNACAGCHEKDDKWAWEAFQELFGTVDSIHYSDKLVPGVMGLPHGDTGLLELIKDKNHTEVVRASAVKALSHYNVENFINEYLSWLDDESAIVRGATIDILSEINSTDYVNSFLPLLKDPKRSVRIKAFYGLSGMDESSVPEAYKELYEKVKLEFFAHLDTNSDFVGGRAKRANYYLKKGDFDKGIAGYESALSMDNLNNQLRLTLANLYYNVQNFTKAEQAFKTVIEQEPDYGPAYYSLALLYAELGQNDDAIELLNKAITKMPENPRLYYNLSLLYDQVNDNIKAENILKQGLTIDDTNESLLYALAYHYSKTNQPEKAKTTLIKLVQLYPNNPQYANFLAQFN
ncbi:tetratricopeptide repeat protein [Algibacter luteus]|uniref:Cytochrome c554 and c-prime n=1 Tax=Algibacter luteus TaxID=1178825 RepID=A0A1M6E771_9FLAO|nr:tetratricopeptide repeat protein [Algibacter luteus]SHI81336.1 Cytochrome c554 and c-prime [Algibacter luteus]